MLGAALFCAGVPSGFADETRAESQARADDDVRIHVEGFRNPVETSDVQYAVYTVQFGKSDRGDAGDATYKIAYVNRDGRTAILECEPLECEYDLTSRNIPERIKDHLLMSSIVAIVGKQREFSVGQRYDSEFKEKRGTRPLFKFECTERDDINGMTAYRLEVDDALRGRRELDVVISPEFPFPLVIREYVGSDPILVAFAGTETMTVSANLTDR
jgi:hypothetical protein